MDEIMMAVIKTVLTAIVSALIGAVVAHIKTKARVKQEDIEAMQARERALEAGMCALLRNELIRAHDQYMKLGYCPIFNRDSLEKMYIAYTSLGGNGSITHLWHEIQDLPTDPT